MNNDMPASYDSWKTDCPPELDYEDYEVLILEKHDQIKSTLALMYELCDPVWPDLDADNLLGMIHDLDNLKVDLVQMQHELNALEEQQGDCKPVDW